jgi:hypothetical protein
VIAEPMRLPPTGLPDHAQREPAPRDVARVQDELGIRAQPRLASYGPTSSFSEELLFRAYSGADPAIEIG